jgi:hypothetical protein
MYVIYASGCVVFNIWITSSVFLLKVFVETAYASEVFEAIKYNSSVFFSNTG